ncbi:MAG: hypothetical protein KDD29_02255 [Flavobacteriales bacterium]|nr:hypothetical protein [Flavobacteriales bacterium]
MSLLKRKYSLIFMVLGAIGGYLYWNYVGCVTGSCAITSVWWRSTIYGAIIGWLLGDLINDKLNKRKEHEN